MEEPPKKTCSACGKELSPDCEEEFCASCLLKLAATETGDGEKDEFAENADPISHNTPHPTSHTPTPIPNELIQSFPNLEFVARIGRGGMGTVYKAKQAALERFVAIKILEPRNSKKSFNERFLREAQILAKLNHPNIVSVYDFGEVHGIYYLLMEYVEGVNLRELMRTEPISPEQALTIIPKICEALQYAHSEGVLHRDIKPENILIDIHGVVKIADFGIGKLVQNNDEQLTQTGTILGTPNYMAPEQFETPLHVDHRADIYSLGVVFYELLTGEVPRGSFPMPSETTQVNSSVDSIVVKALKRRPEQRHQSARELQDELETLDEPGEIPNDFPKKWSRSLGKFAFCCLILGCVMLILMPAIFRVFRENDTKLSKRKGQAQMLLRWLETEQVKEKANPRERPVRYFQSEIPDAVERDFYDRLKTIYENSIVEAISAQKKEIEIIDTKIETLNANRKPAWYVATFGILWSPILVLLLGFFWGMVHLNRLAKCRSKIGLISGGVAVLGCSLAIVFGAFWIMINLAETGVGI